MPKIINEFVDARNGNRYGPGDEDKIDPPLTDEQVQRLTDANCLEAKSARSPRVAAPVAEAAPEVESAPAAEEPAPAPAKSSRRRRD
ncbi:MAG TPA: hypothetical protein VFJ46_17570 [Xanthobacteraceae bacterium]|nr:hypothetical protein [Xanthobacteraceae bacterium]